MYIQTDKHHLHYFTYAVYAITWKNASSFNFLATRKLESKSKNEKWIVLCTGAVYKRNFDVPNYINIPVCRSINS